MKAPDDGNFACGIFADLHKAFDTLDHSILLSKLCYYGIRGLTNKSFESYLANHKQFVSINGFASSTSSIASGVPQGSVLGPLPFLLYINDLHVAIKPCTVHHFADDTSLLIVNKSLKRLNKLSNSDLKNLTNWFNANKISLNVSKTELIIFKPKRKPLDFNMKIKLNGKRLYPTDSVKCLGVKIDSKLNWESHVNATATKLNRANTMLYKVRDFVNANIPKLIYYALFESHINYACIIWGQNISTINRLYILQKKAFRIINFKEHNAHSCPLFHYSRMIKIADKVKIENCLFINKYSNNKLPSIFTNWFTFSSMSHNYQT